MDTFFPDISYAQPNADIAGIRKMTDVIAARASYGTAIDVTMPGRRDAIRGQNFDCVLYYLFLRATQDVGAQVAAVTKLLGDLRPGESVVVDFEKDGTMPTVAQRDQADALLKVRYNRPTVVYDSASTDAADPTSEPVWVASYGVSVEPGVRHAFWQYTDGKYTSAGYKPISWPGCGYIDSNVFHGSGAQLAALLGSVANPVVFGPITSTQEAPLNRQTIHIPSLDAQGNGWISTNAPWDKYVNSFVAGPAPQRDGYGWPNIYSSPNNTNGLVELEFEGGAPGGAIVSYLSPQGF